MDAYRLHIRAVVTSYVCGEEEGTDAVDFTVATGKDETRFTLPPEAEGVFTLGAPVGDPPYAVLTFPNKEGLVLRLGEEYEIAYEESGVSLGEPSSVVYEGTAVLETAE